MNRAWFGLVHWTAACFLLAAMAIPQANGAEDWRDIARTVSGKIDATRRDLSALKTDLLSSNDMLERQIGEARDNARKWDQTARQEADPAVRGVLIIYRDGFTGHAYALTTVRRMFVDLGRLGQGLESDQSLLSSFQEGFEASAKASSGKASPQERSRNFELIVGLLKVLDIRQKELDIVLVGLSQRTADLRNHNAQLRALLADMSPATNKAKQWEREAVEEELRHSSTEANHLAAAGRFGLRMLDAIGKTGETLRAQNRMVASF